MRGWSPSRTWEHRGTSLEGWITFEHELNPYGRESDLPLLWGLAGNEGTIGEGEPVGRNALDQALWACSNAIGGATQVAGYERLDAAFLGDGRTAQWLCTISMSVSLPTPEPTPPRTSLKDHVGVALPPARPTGLPGELGHQLGEEKQVLVPDETLEHMLPSA